MKTIPPIFVASRAFCGRSLLAVFRPPTSVLRPLISAPAVLCLLTSVLCLSASAQTWILDGRKLVTATDPQAARNFGTNTVYQTTNAVARWIALTNGLALEVHSSTGWVRQVEYTEE